MATNNSPTSVVEGAVAAVAAANAQPVAPASSATVVQPPAESAQQAFSPDTTAQLERRGSGTTTMPREWLDSTKEVRLENRGGDAFGAMMAGNDVGAPADLTSGGAVSISDEEAAADESGIASGGAIKVDDGTEGEAQEAAAEGETETAAETQETTDTAEKTETEPEKPAAKVDLMKQGRQIRRTALDAMRIEAEKRQLEQRVRDERTAREATEARANAAVKEKQEFEARLQKAPLEERLRLIGIRDRDALLEMQLRGEIGDIKEPEGEKPTAAAPDPERAALLKRMEELEARDRQRTEENERIQREAQAAQAQAQAQVAATRAREMLSTPELAPAFKFTLATPGAIEEVMTRAADLWRASGAVNGDISRHVIAAAKEAEGVLTDQYAPILKAAGVQPAAKPAPAGKQPGPVVPTKPTVAKPAVAGKRLGASGTRTEDDLPLDGMLRDAIIKRDMGWGGSH